MQTTHSNIYTIATAKEMNLRAEQHLQNTKKFLLSGPLGAGKTEFVKGVAQGLSIDPDAITSPTYTYMQTYDDKLLHIDMYRINDQNFLYEKGLLEYIEEYPYVCIERPRRSDVYADRMWSAIIIEPSQNSNRLCTTMKRSP